MADYNFWYWVGGLFLGIVLLIVVLSIVICLCRRRCVKRRIREALQATENYQGTPKTSISNISPNSNLTKSSTKFKSSSKIQNIDDESEDEIHYAEDDVEAMNHAKNGNKRVMLDLSSDAKYNNKYRKDSKGGNTTLINQDGNMRPQNNETLNTNKHNRAIHGTQTSFVLDADVDYFHQIQQMDNNNGRDRKVSHTASHVNKKRNIDIVDDDIDEDIEIDYNDKL